jgi:hypothetical protein
MIAPVKKKIPAAKIIVLHAAPVEKDDAFPPPDAEWNPLRSISVQDFLEREIPDAEAAEIKIIEWRPAMTLYGGYYLALVEETAAFIKRADANARTLKAFGCRWFRNFFKNLDLIRKIFCPPPLSLPALVAGAGPGLEEVIPLVQEEYRRGSLFVLAVSSAAAAMEAAAMVPQMVIATDGGGWARFHLYECFRGNYLSETKEVPSFCLAAALTAALPSQCETLPVLPISDGSLWQVLVLKKLGIPFIVLPQRGTVSAAALDLAFALTKGEVFIAGVDLDNRDIRSHVRPYSFDRFHEEGASRINPVYSQTYKRSSLIKDGGSHGIYASWFAKQLEAYPKRLHSLGKNNPLFGSLETSVLNLSGLPETAGKPAPLRASRNISIPPGERPSHRALTFLRDSLENPEYSGKLAEELISLLLPGRKKPSPGELEEALVSSACRGGRNG